MAHRTHNDNDEDDFLSSPSDMPLRVCCYGSSSSSTPLRYLAQAEALGRALARRGHTCVNGAGCAGCMAAMNDGASEEGGHIVGVIHEVFVVDGSDWVSEGSGAHSAFHGGKREILVAGGGDLQERKRLLVEGANALVVLPGGPGTFDELWEMVCARNLGFADIPIVCINVDGYYEPFRSMLDRAYRDKMVRNRPEDILHFEADSVSAVKWIENAVQLQQQQQQTTTETTKESPKKNAKAYRRMDSALTVDPPLKDDNNVEESATISALRHFFLPVPSKKKWKGGVLVDNDDGLWKGYVAVAGFSAMTLAVGVAIGVSVATRSKKL